MVPADAMELFDAREGPVGSVTLSAALREMLPFPAPDPLPVGHPPEGEDPATPTLALTADVRHVPMSELLGLLHRARRSGLLLFGYRDHAKSVYVHGGEVVFAASNLAGDRVGESLVRSGVLGLDQLRQAERGYAPGQRFGKVLVEAGYVTPRELWHGVKLQVEGIVRSLFSYTEGAVYFFAGDVKPDNVVRLSLPTERLVEEGVQEREALRRFLETLRDPELELARTEGAGDDLEGPERLIYQALSEERSFPRLLEALDLEPRAAARAIQMLRRVGAVELMKRPEPRPEPTPARTDDEEPLRRSVNAHLKLIAELAAPIVAAEGARPLRERMEPVLEEVAHRYPAVLAGVSLGPAATLDPGPVVVRALGLAGDRLEPVRAALGELVSYLEFELKNHPDVPEPGPFLDAVEGLRADL
jgi:hypothetical protein